MLKFLKTNTKKLLCKHDYKTRFISYQDRYRLKICKDCKKEVYEDMD